MWLRVTGRAPIANFRWWVRDLMWWVAIWLTLLLVIAMRIGFFFFWDWFTVAYLLVVASSWAYVVWDTWIVWKQHRVRSRG